MKIGLGTVQFGLDYGISNPDGKTNAEEITRILNAAARNKIRVIDTASLYGTSEEVLGRFLPPGHKFDIVTKTPVFNKDRISPSDAKMIREAFGRSLDKMGRTSLYGLLVHNCDDLLAENGPLIMEVMAGLKERGLVEKIGVSVYTGGQIDRVLERYDIDVIQVPINVLDQRLLAGGHLSRLKSTGVEIHARSAFLQGLLLMDPDSLPPFFDGVRGHLKKYHQAMRTLGISPVGAALGFVAGIREVDVVLCGVNNHRQLEEICRLAKDPVDSGIFSGFAIDDDCVLNPSLWRT